MTTTPTVRAVAALMAAVLVAIGGADLARSDPAAAQTGGRLELEAQTLFVDENPVELVLRVSGAPDGAELEVTIYGTPLDSIEALRASHEDAPPGRRLSFFTCPLDEPCGQADVEFGAAGRVTLTLLEEEIGEALRSNAGALSMVVRLLHADGLELDSLHTNLFVLDEEDKFVDVRLGFVARVGAPLAIRPGQSVEIDPAAVLDAAEGLRERPRLPVTIEVRPETLETLFDVDPEALGRLFDALGGRPVMRTPWVAMDEEAWRAAGAETRVITQYARGNDTIESILQVSPTELVRLDPDAGPATLGLLRSAGAGAVIVDAAQVTSGAEGLDRLQPFRLLDENGLAITALRIDDDLQSTLADPDSTLGGYRALAELALAARTGTTDLGALLDFDTLDPRALDVLLEGIDARPELSVVDVTELLDLEPARTASGTPIRGELIAVPPADVSALAAELRAATTAVDTLAAMVDPETGPIDPLRTRLLAAVSSDLTIDEARIYAATVFDDVLAGTSGLRIAPSDRITLTDRRTAIPLVIINDQPLPINVEILLSAEKLRFPDGDRLPRTLRPGENRLTIPVETLASGDARVTATLISPGGLFELGSGTVDIRSTAISGLGLVISIVALLILGAWWIRTILRIRRNRVAATVSAASAKEDEPPRTEGEP